MGNQLAPPQKFEQDHLADVPFVVFKEHLGGSRLLKTVVCRHDRGGQVVVKVYQKRGDVDLDKHTQQLQHIRSRLSDLPASHVWPFQHFFATEKAAYLMRQHIFANLYHRLSTRPFFGNIEKQWIAYQLLLAMAQSHEQGICHGDIKCENVLVTSWNWIYLADYAPYKPAFLPADNPADFSFFFDTGGRRRCYLAPERFFDKDSSDLETLADAPLQPSMDIFSLGCVLAELFLDGQRLFDLSELLAYRAKKFDPAPTLARVEEPFKSLILHMINLNPDERSTASGYLADWGGKLFPFYFHTLLHPFISALQPLDADDRIDAIEREFPSLVETIVGPGLEARPTGRRGLATPRDIGSPADLPHDMGAGTGKGKPVASGKEALSKLCSGTVLMSENLQNKGPRRAEDSAVDQSRNEPQADSARPDPTDTRSVVMEVTYEYQCRERGRAFLARALSDSMPAFKEWQPPKSRRKEDIHLPPDSGWQWTDDWHLDKETATDASGWAYRVVTDGGAYSWSPKCVLDCLWRRRKWTRQRRKAGPLLPETKGSRRRGQDPVNSQGFVIVATLLCSTLRGAYFQDHKSKAIRLLMIAAKYCDDDTRVQRIIPYLMECMNVPLCKVRWAALQGLVHVLSLVRHLTPTDAKLFNEYVLPSLSMVPNDKEEWMLVAYAQAIGLLAASAHQYLLNSHNANPTPESQAKYDAELVDTREKVERVVHEMMVSSKSSRNVKLAVLGGMQALATFLGSKESNDFLLPLLLASLNSPDWRLKSSFLAAAGNLAQHAGPTGVESYLVPCLPQALEDKNAAVVAEAVEFLANVTKLGLLRRRSLLAVLSAQKDLNVLPALLRHDAAAVRRSAVSFLEAAAQQLSLTDSFVYLKPKVAPAFQSEPFSLAKAEDIVRGLPPQTVQAKPEAPVVQNSAASKDKRASGKSKAGVKETQGQPQGLMLRTSASVYSVSIDKSRISATQSYFSAALDQNAQLLQGAERAEISSAETLMLRAKRMVRASPDMSSLHPGLVPAPALQLGSDEALSFQADSWRGSPVRGSVNSAMDAAIHTSLPTGTARKSVSTHPWQPQGVLVMHMAEHKQAVNRLAVAGNSAFFASASDDGTVKIWDSRSLDKDPVFRSRLTYNAQGGRILGCTACEDNQSMASASSDGSIHVWRVEYQSRTRNIPDRYVSVSENQHENANEGGILALEHWDSLLVSATERGGIHGTDLRMKSEAWRLSAAPSGGLWRSLVLDDKAKNWLAVGSSRGSVALWDMRFQVCVKEWSVRDRAGIHAMSLAQVGSRRLGLPGNAAAGPLVYISSQSGDVGLWELRNGRCLQVLKPAALEANAPQQSKAVPERAPKAAPHSFATEELQYHASEAVQGVRTIVPTVAGTLLTGGSDGCIRHWDTSAVGQSYIVCGPPVDLDAKSHTTHRTGVSYSTTNHAGVQVVRENSLMTAIDSDAHSTAYKSLQRRVTNSHADSILDLCSLQLSGDRMLLSASADGTVKAWK